MIRLEIIATLLLRFGFSCAHSNLEDRTLNATKHPAFPNYALCYLASTAI
ncbi:MAG: hypothetical protein AAF821_02900 [Cyanobacteria bacterium P01_D01_bin.156]